MNSIAERFVLTIKSECLDHFIAFGEAHLEFLVREFVEEWYNKTRAHQGIGNKPLAQDYQPPGPQDATQAKEIFCQQRWADYSTIIFTGLLDSGYIHSSLRRSSLQPFATSVRFGAEKLLISSNPPSILLTLGDICPLPFRLESLVLLAVLAEPHFYKANSRPGPSKANVISRPSAS